MLTSHPGNPQAVPYDYLPSNIDTVDKTGGLGTDFHLKVKNNEDGKLER